MMKKQKRTAIVLTAILLCIASAFAVIVFASNDSVVTKGEMVDIKNDFSAYLVQDTAVISNDGFVGKLQYTVYYDKTNGAVKTGIGGTPIIAYAINTLTERVGTDSNKTIIQSMLDRGYVVVVLDYLENSKAEGHTLDDSAQSFVKVTRCGKYGI